jgi:hypothetical protein
MLLHGAGPIGTIAPSLHRTKGKDHLPSALFRQRSEFLRLESLLRLPAGIVFRGKFLLQFQRLGTHAQSMLRFRPKVSNYPPVNLIRMCGFFADDSG